MLIHSVSYINKGISIHHKPNGQSTSSMDVVPDKMHLSIRGPWNVYPWLVPPRNLPYLDHLQREKFRSEVLLIADEALTRMMHDVKECMWMRKIAKAELIFRDK